MFKQTVPIPAAHQGLPPTRPSDPLRSPRPRRSQQPGQEPEPDRTQPASQPRSGRWC
ncbi:hypothetical protein [Hymenobacter jeollabukensis]|uniref:hypothetical protein n=1 Tax=Hymenobacter jeollabukensis TaxID=2025313 RepID=UPI0014857A44|nr:hypothetical protein [Hymenobacter jeollabukensis]